MDGKLHSHGFNELAEGIAHRNKVIVDIKHKDLFSTVEVYGENHVIVDWDEFIRNGGEVRFVSI